jgi:hypothetical protein
MNRAFLRTFGVDRLAVSRAWDDSRILLRNGFNVTFMRAIEGNCLRDPSRAKAPELMKGLGNHWESAF